MAALTACDCGCRTQLLASRGTCRRPQRRAGNLGPSWCGVPISTPSRNGLLSWATPAPSVTRWKQPTRTITGWLRLYYVFLLVVESARCWVRCFDTVHTIFGQVDNFSCSHGQSSRLSIWSLQNRESVTSCKLSSQNCCLACCSNFL